MGRPLLEERVIALYPRLVRALESMAAAAALQQLHYHLSTGKTVEWQGERWAPLMYSELGRELGLTGDQARRAVERLEKGELVLSCQPSGQNRRKLYRINYEHPTLADAPSHVATVPALPGAAANSPSLEGLESPPSGGSASPEAEGEPHEPTEKERADALTREWWEAMRPRPSTPFVGCRKIVEAVVVAGWPDHAIKAALRRIGRGITRYKLEQALELGAPEGPKRAGVTNPAAIPSDEWDQR